VAVLALDEFHRLADRFNSGGEVAGLVLEFGCLVCAVRDDNRRGELGNVALRLIASAISSVNAMQLRR